MCRCMKASRKMIVRDDIQCHCVMVKMGRGVNGPDCSYSVSGRFR